MPICAHLAFEGNYIRLNYLALGKLNDTLQKNFDIDTTYY